MTMSAAPVEEPVVDVEVEVCWTHHEVYPAFLVCEFCLEEEALMTEETDPADDIHREERAHEVLDRRFDR